MDVAIWSALHTIIHSDQNKLFLAIFAITKPAIVTVGLEMFEFNMHKSKLPHILKKLLVPQS